MSLNLENIFLAIFGILFLTFGLGLPVIFVWVSIDSLITFFRIKIYEHFGYELDEVGYKKSGDENEKREEK